MIGTIERIKNSVLLKCSTLNDEIISKTLTEIINTRIYRFSEELISMLENISIWDNEEVLRNKVAEIIKIPIMKKVKRKLFIDSLALQITNDSYIEDYVNEKVSLEKLKKDYIKELLSNKSSNQLNMTEDLNLTEIINNLNIYFDKEVIPKVNENSVLANSILNLVSNLKEELESELNGMIEDADNKYLNILVKELEENVTFERTENVEIGIEEKGEENMISDLLKINAYNNDVLEEEKINKFDKYDDMTLFNKMILSLNTTEEKLTRKESKLEASKKEVDERLSVTNKNIESNIERENKLSQRKLELNAREIELNSKLSEAEVIFLNMKPLIKGLNKIKETSLDGGNENE